MNKELIIVGAGGHGRVVADVAASMKYFKNILFIDDNLNQIAPHHVLTTTEHMCSQIHEERVFIVAIGHNETRSCLASELRVNNAQFTNIVHPSAVLGSRLTLGTGILFMPNAVVNANAVIGDDVIINTASVVEHDVILESSVHLGPNATLAGAAHVGYRSLVGAAAVVLPNVSIGQDCTIGAGCVVTSNVPNKKILVGNPARYI